MKTTNSDTLALMVLFQITLMPLVLLAMLFLYEPGSTGGRKFIEHVVWGLRTFIVAVLIYLIVFRFVGKVFTSGGLLFFHAFKDYVLWGVLWLGGYSLLYRWKNLPVREGLKEVFSYGLGFFLLLGALDGVEHFRDYNVYNLFLLPVIRVGLFCGVSFIVAWGRDIGGFMSVGSKILGIVVFALGGGLAYLFFSGHHILAVLASVLLIALGLLPHFLLRKGR